MELEFGAGGFAIGFQTDLMDTFPFGQLIVQDRDRPALRLFFGTTLLTTNKHTTDIKLGFSKFNAKFNYKTTDSWGMPQQPNWKYYNTTLDFLTISTRISENLNAYKSKFFVKFDIDFNFIVWSKLSQNPH